MGNETVIYPNYGSECALRRIRSSIYLLACSLESNRLLELPGYKLFASVENECRNAMHFNAKNELQFHYRIRIVSIILT